MNIGLKYRDLIPNYFILDLLEAVKMDYSLSINVNPTNIFRCVYSTNKKITLDIHDEGFAEIHNVFVDFLGLLKNRYGETHIFTEPNLLICNCPLEFTLKIGMMEKPSEEEKT